VQGASALPPGPESGAIAAPAEQSAALSGISAREREIVAHLAAGRRNSEICRALFISESTVKTHIKSIYRKLGVGNRVQLVNLIGGRGPKAPGSSRAADR
jgi:DNA-binding CsgD family transcriptional regulator